MNIKSIPKRKSISKSEEKELLVLSRRRCCLCVYLDNRDEVRKGQIAHLNGKSNESQLDNLVWLCLEHHDDFDGRRSQSKGFTVDEVREYRELLYRRHQRSDELNQSEKLLSTEFIELQPLPPISVYEKLRMDFPKIGFTAQPWRYPLWQVANEPEYFAYKAGNRADGVCLIERIDIPDGRIVIACIQTPGNPGNSITNCVEYLCFQVCERFEIPPEKIVWLEHYDYYQEEGWELVTFSEMPPDKPFGKPKWTLVTSEIWKDLRLKPKKRLIVRNGHVRSKLTKLFHWPTEGIFD